MATPIEQLELMKNLEENFDGYGGSPPAGPVREMAKEFVKLIVAKREQMKKYDGVFVTPGRDASVLIEWDDDQYEHELEVNADGSLGFLHTEKASGVMVERAYRPGQFSIAPGLITELCELVAV